jgi:uncharacterized RDD family membrane protein YckC
MKCPKCGYLGFEPVDRCRNCGYDFSLTSSSADLELPLRRGPELDVDVPDTMAAAPVEAVASHDHASVPVELPLFGAPIADDVPLITKASAPRPPLSVRRATPDVPRVRTVAPRTATLDLALEPPPSLSDPVPAAPPFRSVSPARESERHTVDENAEDASLVSRLVAVVLDVLILGAIDVGVVYFTLQICGVGLEELRVLPWVPLVAFFILQNGGYLVAFTAGGQTLGKMATGIRVVPAEPRSSLDVGRAFVRELTWLALVVPAGLGFLSALFSHDHRGLHDRFAGTKVVRASL